MQYLIKDILHEEAEAIRKSIDEAKAGNDELSEFYHGKAVAYSSIKNNLVKKGLNKAKKPAPLTDKIALLKRVSRYEYENYAQFIEYGFNEIADKFYARYEAINKCIDILTNEKIFKHFDTEVFPKEQ